MQVAEARVGAMRGAAGILLSLEETTLGVVCRAVLDLGVPPGDPVHSRVVIEYVKLRIGYAAGQQRRWLNALEADDDQTVAALIADVHDRIVAFRAEAEADDVSTQMDALSPTSTLSISSQPATPIRRSGPSFPATSPPSPTRTRAFRRARSPDSPTSAIAIDDIDAKDGSFTAPAAMITPTLRLDNLPPDFQSSDLHDYLCHLATHSVAEDVVWIECDRGEGSASAKVSFVSWARAGVFLDQHVAYPILVDGRPLAISWA